MSYCINPACSKPKNIAGAFVCENCGSSLILHERYHILGILGKGGFGATFAASDLSLPNKSLCVIKQLRPATNDPRVFRMAKELFEREAETLGKVGVHPQVPRLLNYFEDNQQFYLVQEYVRGHNLHQEVKKGGPFSEVGVKQFLSELLPILQYIHQQKVIHRDIKPANLIRRQTDQKLVLIDFGAVKNQVNTILANSSHQTALTAFAVGTQGFAPPEQMAMRPVYASDIYAVGITCLYLLTGKSPKEMEVDANTGELLWEKWVTVSPPFAKVLKTMIEVSVRHRYKSALEVLTALDMTAYAESLAQSMIFAPAPTRSRRDVAVSPNPSIPARNEGVSPVPPLTNRNVRRPLPPATPAKVVDNVPDRDMSLSMNNASPPPRAQARKAADATSTSNSNKKKTRLDGRGILEEYHHGRRDFAQEEFNVLYLPKAKLPGICFYQSKLVGANLQEADLSNADLGRSSLNQAILRSTNLNSAYLSYADLEKADLRGADLTGANLRNANLRGANLCGANLCGAQVTQEQISMAKTNWLTVMPSGKRGFW